jgi:hypothetical protein
MHRFVYIFVVVAVARPHLGTPADNPQRCAPHSPPTARNQGTKVIKTNIRELNVYCMFNPAFTARL